MATLDRTAIRFGWTLLTYCLMRNHYHLVVRIDERGLARGMCELNTAYARQFNVEHGRINHLFGKRYWSEFLEVDTHLQNAIRYVIQNPRRAGAPGPLENHPWTSYRATIGLELPRIRCLAPGEALGLFGTDPANAIDQFREFCETPVPEGHVPCQAPSRKGARPRYVTVYSGPLPPSGGVSRPPLAVIAPHWTQFEGVTRTSTVPSPASSPTS